MPTYIFDKDAFVEFVKKHLEEDTVVVVSSDFADSEIKPIDTGTGIGLKDYFVVKNYVSADIFKEPDAEEFDCMFRYMMVFCEKDDLTDDAVKKIRKQ